MKRLLIAMLLVVVSGAPAFAFDDSRVEKVRVGVLRGADELQTNVAEVVVNELRARGIDAFHAIRTYEEAIEDGAAIADFYVEIAGNASTTEHGGIGIGARHVGVSVGLLVSRVAAEVRIYDGETMELVRSHDLSKRNTSLAPTSIGFGGGALFAYIAMPYIERAQLRRVVRATGRSAALLVSEVAEAR